MSSKTVPLSVRVSADDALFLSNLQIDGAVTPSEKLRALLHEAQRRQAGFSEPAEGGLLLREMATGARRRLRRLEANVGKRSDLMLKLYERVPDIMAKLIAGPNGEEDNGEQLAAFEQELTDLLAVLLKDFITVGLSSPARVYDEPKYRAELEPVIQLVELVRHHQRAVKGVSDE